MKQTTFLILACMLLAGSCKKDKLRIIDSGYQPDTNPSKFTNSTNITNPYYPVAAGKKYIYEGQTY